MKKINLNEIKIGTKIKYRHPNVKDVTLNGRIAVIHKTTTITKNAERTDVWFEDELSGCDVHYVGNHISPNQIIEIIKNE